MSKIDVQYVSQIILKLHRGIQLDDYEINLINVALRMENNIKQEPYYEVVYHDEYDHTEHRIMNPVSKECFDHSDYMIQSDKFEVNFNRYIPKRSEKIIQNESQTKPIKSEEDIFVDLLDSNKHVASREWICFMIESYIQVNGSFSLKNGERVRKILNESSEGEDGTV